MCLPPELVTVNLFEKRLCLPPELVTVNLFEKRFFADEIKLTVSRGDHPR